VKEEQRILITAGPTREPIDPVRYLGNRSSGRMGFALAEAFAKAGNAVTLVSGPVYLDTPDGVARVDVETAAEMFDAVAANLAEVDVAIFAAAVADFRPKRVAGEKIKKGGEGEADLLTLRLERTMDILGSVRDPLGFGGTLVGFAAETENLQENARAKLQRKGCDLVIANDVSRSDIGFDSSDNEVLLVFRDGLVEALPMQSKTELARQLVEVILELAAP
jgi:phosphopantothenoylcysteine decarboxylase/phosphopantothenate--cysteine ligase